MSKTARWILVGIAVLVGSIVVGAYLTLRGSLPMLDGQVVAAELNAPVTIERDSLGVATITASNRVDLAYATGYAHGQDRYFQMDLQRRAAAGELSSLLGAQTMALDKRFRKHNFRNIARQVLAEATIEQRTLIDAYVAGVNAAGDTDVRPFEYLLLRVVPEPWRAEDCILAAFSMYIELNDSDGVRELERARLHASLPQTVFDVLYPRSSEWMRR